MRGLRPRRPRPNCPCPRRPPGTAPCAPAPPAAPPRRPAPVVRDAAGGTQERRAEAVLRAVPGFAGAPAALRRLVAEPSAGAVWHADHLVPVAQGGGECGLLNLRCLCVLCHARKTREEAQARAAAARAARSAAGQQEGETAAPDV